MSSVPEGWYVDPSTGTNLRWWSGSTWTDEVAPLPYEQTHAGPVDFVAVSPAPANTQTAANSQTAANTQTVADALVEPAPETVAAISPEEPAEGPNEPVTVLDPEIEVTHLTRRELRARRNEATPNDCPKHLPLDAESAVAAAPLPEPAEQVELPAPASVEAAGAETSAQTDAEADPDTEDPGRRRRILRMSVLLGILTVVSSVGVLTAGRL